MKHIVLFIFLLLLLSCQGRSRVWCESSGKVSLDSVVADSKCRAIMRKAHKEAEASGFCYVGPLSKGFHKEAIDPDPEKCDAFYEEGGKKCDALPPIEERPEDLEYVSGSAFIPFRNLVMIDGKPVPICP